MKIRVSIVCAGIALLASGCTAESAAQAPAPLPVELQEVTITAVDYRYSEAPTQLSGGVIDLTFENRGEVTHEVSLTGIGDTTPEQYMDDLLERGGNGLDGSPFPDYVGQVAVPAFAGPGDTTRVTFTLTEGNYALFCAFPDAAKGDRTNGKLHYQLGMMQPLTVTGGPAEPVLPPADGTITATDDSLEIDIDAGDEVVNFVNEGPNQVHLSTVEEYPKGVDEEEARVAFEIQLRRGPLPEGIPGAQGRGFSGIYSEGLSGTFRLYAGRFVSGRTYLFQCVMFDREGGEPHVRKYDQWTVVTIE